MSLRSRSSRQALLRILALAALTWLLLWLGEESVFVPLLQTMMPVAVASVIGLSADSPFAELEETTSRSRVLLRLAHLGGLLLVAAVALRLGDFVVPQPGSWPALVRNTLGYTGLTLVAWRLFGAPYSWVLPLLYASLVFASSGAHLWAWPLYEPGEQEALMAALALLGVGMACALSPVPFAPAQGRMVGARIALNRRSGRQSNR